MEQESVISKAIDTADNQNDYSGVTNPHLTKFDFDLNMAVFGENKNITAQELKLQYPKKKSPNFLHKKYNLMCESVTNAYNDLLKTCTSDFSVDSSMLSEVGRSYREFVDCGYWIETYQRANHAAKGNFSFDAKDFAKSVTLKDAVSKYRESFITVGGVNYYPIAHCNSYMLFCYHDNGDRKYKLIYKCPDYQSEVIIQKNELAYYNKFFEGKYEAHTRMSPWVVGADFMKRYTYYSNALGELTESLEKNLTTHFNL